MTVEAANMTNGEDITTRKLSRAERKRQRAQDAASTGSAKKLKGSAFLPLSEPSVVRHRRCIIEYDGSNFHGFQAQERRNEMRTVQETIEDAIARTTGESVRVRGCSRTDSGVHARGQVVAFASACSVDDATFRSALNTRLPEDVVCRSLETLPLIDGAENEAFDPRANATGKIYEYVVVSGATRPALDRHRAWVMRKPLDTAAMSKAIELITGAPKDFSAFTPPKSSALNEENAKGNVCTVWTIELHEEPLRDEDDCGEDDTKRIRLRFHGDRFLYKMVRNIVGTLVDVGLGRIQPETIATLFESKDRSRAGQGAPPHGLTLVRLLYE